MHITQAIPRSISQGTTFVVTTSVDIIRNPAAYDVRRQNRDETFRRADLSYNIRRLEDPLEQERSLYEILSHFEVCEGPVHTFPCLDRLDFKTASPRQEISATDVLIAEGDGGTTTFQLRKGYTIGSVTKYRSIFCPVADSALVALGGVLQASSEYEISEEFGTIEFDTPVGTGVDITAGFKFYLKVRFDTNDLSQAYEGFRVGSISSIPVIEVRS